jgi:osmotically inducible protein OsmC
MKRVTFSRSAHVQWQGDVARGSGIARADSGAFETAVTFPTLRGEANGTTTPEELLAASHATCYAIGLRSVLARHGGSASRLTVTATVTAEKDSGAIRILQSHLTAVLDGVTGLDATALERCAEAAKRECTISNALSGPVTVSHEVRSRASAADPVDP